MNEPKPLAVVTSDCHLQERAWASRKTLEGDAAWSFEYIVDIACDLRVPIIGAGDLIDKQENNSNVPGFMRRMMDKCELERSRFLYIQGQHELQRDPWLSELSDWPIWLPGETGGALCLEDNRTGIYGIDWTPVGELEAKLAEVPDDTDILVMHQLCHEYMGSIASPELDWHMIPDVKMLIIGDYHKKHGHTRRENAAGNLMTVLCPGSTCMQAIDEPPVKKYFVLYDDLSVESCTIPTRPFLRPPDLETDEDLNGFVEAVGAQISAAIARAADEDLPADLCKPIVYARYVYDLPNAYGRLVRAVGGDAHLFTKELRPKTEEQVESRKERKKVLEGGLLGSLSEVASDKSSARYEISHLLLSAKNPREALSQLRKEYLDAEG